MNPFKKLATPLALATFAVVGTTGVMLFLRFGVALIKEAHERLGLVLVAAVVLHVVRNFRGLRSYAASWPAWVAVGVVLALGTLFIGESAFSPPEPAGDRALRALARSDLADTGALLGLAPEQVRGRLLAAGLTVPSDKATLAEVARVSSRPLKDVVRSALSR